jgi:hypothetical protein
MEDAAIRLEGFSPAEQAMIQRGFAALRAAGYEPAIIRVLIRVDMPPRYRAMTLADGAALGEQAFVSQTMLNHVLEEELRHLRQKERGQAEIFAPGTARRLEEEVDAERTFPFPET